GGLGYSGLANLEQFVRDGGLLIAIQASAAVPVAGAMTDMVNVSEPRAMQAPGSVLQSTIDDKKSPIAYGYDDKLYVYFRQGPVITVSTGLGGGQGGPGGGGGGAAGGEGAGGGRASGWGCLPAPEAVPGGM